MKSCSLFIGALGGLLLANAATAAVRLDLDTVLNGSAPGSSIPWLSATFTTLFPGTVELTLQANLEFPSEFITEVTLNLNPALNPSTLLFSSSGMPAYDRIQAPAGGNGVNLGGAGAGGGGCDISIKWPSSGGSGNRFDGTDSLTISISGPQNLVAEDFLYYNTVNGRDGLLMIGAHAQGIPAGDGTTISGAIIQTIPEPGALTLLFCGFLAFFARRSRRK